MVFLGFIKFGIEKRKIIFFFVLVEKCEYEFNCDSTCKPKEVHFLGSKNIRQQHVDAFQFFSFIFLAVPNYVQGGGPSC